MQQYIDALTSELVTLAQAGDGKALAAVLAASDPRLRAMARRVQKSSDWEETLVQYGRMGVVKALRMYQVGRGSFWTFAYMHVKGSMIDGYAAELGLSSDARKAYPKVVRTYRQLAANHTRPPASAEVAAACGVTAGMVEQIVNVLFRTWLTLDEIAEHTPDALPPPDTPQSLYNAAPDTLIAAQDDLAQRRSLVQELYTSCLGADEAARFLVLQILREGSGGYDYGWEEIAAALCGTAGPPHPDWAHTVAAEFADWTRLPPTWAAVRELFLRQHPAPTSAYLRQRFSQDRRALGDIAEQTQDADPLLIATPSPYKTPSPYNSCLDRYPDIQISHKVRISQTCTVRVAVTIQPAVQQFAAAVMAAVFPESNEAVIVDVVITADDFEILDNTVKQLIVPFDKDSDPIVFRLRPEAIGKKTVRVEFYQDDRYIGGAQVITEVTDAGSKPIIPETPLRETARNQQPIRLARAEPPDLHMLISQLDDKPHQEMQYRFELYAPSVGLFHYKVSEPLRFIGSPTQWIERVHQELSELNYGERNEDAAIALGKIGTYLYEKLFPDELKTIWIKKIRGNVRSIMIISDEPWIPWEMIKPSFMDEAGVIIEEGFLCEDYAVARWRRDSPPSSNVIVESGAAVVDKEMSHYASQEALLLKGDPYKFTLIEATLVNVRRLLKTYDYRMLHFACHGHFDKQQFDQSVLILGDGNYLRVRDISGEHKNFGQVRPFVFVNACSSSRADFSLVGIGGWAERFINADVSGFLGTSWEVDDELAYEFAEQLYSALWAGDTIGEAVRKSRKAISHSSPTWLAYTLYADPNATFTCTTNLFV